MLRGAIDQNQLKYEVEKLGQTTKDACRAAIAAGVPKHDAEAEARQQLTDDVRKLQDRMSNEEFMLTQDYFLRHCEWVRSVFRHYAARDGSGFSAVTLSHTEWMIMVKECFIESKTVTRSRLHLIFLKACERPPARTIRDMVINPGMPLSDMDTHTLEVLLKEEERKENATKYTRKKHDELDPHGFLETLVRIAHYKYPHIHRLHLQVRGRVWVGEEGYHLASLGPLPPPMAASQAFPECQYSSVPVVPLPM